MAELYELCVRTDQRLLWARWLEWPATRPWATDDDLDEAGLAWVEVQQQLDRGARLCVPCGRWGSHTFCGGCGRRYEGAELRWRECPACRARVATDYCPIDGTHIAIDFLKKMERGEVDWMAEAKMAKGIATRLLRTRPDLTGIAPQDAADVAASLAQVFK